ncbi:TPA: hypothetical protein ACNUZJ_005135 [Raoultella ornithinolytica]
MTSKLTITRERLEKIKSWRETYGAGSNVMLPAEEAEELARMALAAMDSKPVQMFGIGSIFKPQRVIEQEADCDDCAHYNPKICHGEGCPAISQQSAQPAPVVPDDVLDALQKVARIRLDLNGFDGDRRGIADCLCDAEEALIEVVNRRAAMLQGAENAESRCGIQTAPALDSFKKNSESRCGNSPVIPDGSEWTNEQCLEFLTVAFRHNEISGDIEFDDIRLGVKFALSAAPQEVNHG